MIQMGKIFKTDSKRRIRVDGLIKVGGQGEAYWATEMNTGQKGALKVFHRNFANRDTLKRLRYLIGQGFSEASSVLYAPTDLINRRDLLGHYTPLAPGQPLEEFLVNPNGTFSEALLASITLAHAIDTMHRRQIAHGDLHAENLIINQEGSVPQLYVIDFDNFNAPGLPAPPMVGQSLYLAPELRNDSAKEQRAIPNIYTDRFAMGVLMHEIILLRHVAAGSDDNEVAFHNAMCSGRWLHDSAAADRPLGNLDGYPVEVLNADLARLFRSAFSLEPSERPSPHRWECELMKAFDSVYCCRHCGGPSIVDISKTICPFCKRPFPSLTLVTPDGNKLPLERGATLIGRSGLGGSKKVSVCHAVFRRIGQETWLESMGRNGTHRWTGSTWVKLPHKNRVLVQQDDRLRLGDVEVQLV